MIVTVDKAPPALYEATDIVVSVVRPDESVVEREAFAVAVDALDLALHDEDLKLSGRYVGQVSYYADGVVSIFGPAFSFEVPPS